MNSEAVHRRTLAQQAVESLIQQDAPSSPQLWHSKLVSMRTALRGVCVLLGAARLHGAVRSVLRG